jgi:hypothetical protein
MGPRLQGRPGTSHKVVLYVERLLRCCVPLRGITRTASGSEQGTHLQCARQPRRHPSFHTLTSLESFKIWRGRSRRRRRPKKSFISGRFHYLM